MTRNKLHDETRHRPARPLDAEELTGVEGGNPLAAFAAEIIIGEAVTDIASEEMPSGFFGGGDKKQTYKPALPDLSAFGF